VCVCVSCACSCVCVSRACVHVYVCRVCVLCLHVNVNVLTCTRVSGVRSRHVQLHQKTALHEASGRGHAKVVEALLLAGADVDCMDLQVCGQCLCVCACVCVCVCV
jgi:hypothetical protein